MKKLSLLRRLIRFLTPKQLRRPLNADGKTTTVPPHVRHGATAESFRDQQRIHRL